MAKPSPIPIACIAVSHHATTALCGRVLTPQEFVFVSGYHAKNHYRTCSFLRACSACADKVQDETGAFLE